MKFTLNVLPKRDMNKNKFTEGQKVVCISENFPMVRTTETDKSDLGKQAPLHPIKGQVYTIDEILGDFLNFRQFNDHEGFKWFHHSRFAPIEIWIDEAVEGKEVTATHPLWVSFQKLMNGTWAKNEAVPVFVKEKEVIRYWHEETPINGGNEIFDLSAKIKYLTKNRN